MTFLETKRNLGSDMVVEASVWGLVNDKDFNKYTEDLKKAITILRDEKTDFSIKTLTRMLNEGLVSNMHPNDFAVIAQIIKTRADKILEHTK